jgi:hypothetical protein
MFAPSPAITLAEQPCPVTRYAPAKPAEVANATIDVDALAPAPLELVTPSTPSAAASHSSARARSSAGSGVEGSSASRNGSSLVCRRSDGASPA